MNFESLFEDIWDWIIEILYPDEYDPLPDPIPSQSQPLPNISTTKIHFDSLVEDVWYEIIGMLTIKEAFAIYQANPRIFGAFIEQHPIIRYRNVMNSAPSSEFFHHVVDGAEIKNSSFRSWFKRHIFKSCIVPPSKLFPHLSPIIAFNDRGFESVAYIYPFRLECQFNRRG
jgi:hypothetical protein